MFDRFSLKWDDFQTNVTNSFRKLREADDFYDVTLVSTDHQLVSAHKVVLSASSEYFKDVLKSSKNSHPMLCLDGVSSHDVDNLLDYIYNGEIQIHRHRLDKFLQIAQRFQIEGLKITEDFHEIESTKEVEVSEDNMTEIDVLPLLDESKDELKEGVFSPDDKHLKKERRKYKFTKADIDVKSADFQNVEELNNRINEMVEKLDGSKRKCIPCGKVLLHIGVAREHVETHIDGLSFPCRYCDKTLYSRASLRDHMMKRCPKKYNNDEGSFPCQYCDKLFRSQTSFTEHHLYYHGSSSRC